MRLMITGPEQPYRCLREIQVQNCIVKSREYARVMRYTRLVSLGID